jgi:UDP-N-acetylglucosamine 3-dehydrogenase
MRLGIAGCGWIVEREHAPALLEAKNVEVVAVADVAPERARLVGKIFDLPERDCLDDARKLIERSDIDAISIATPPNVRTELVALAAASGKHIICEKPLSTTLADADEMIEVCARAGVKLLVFHNYLYFPETRLARKLIAEGEIGEVLATEITGFGARPWEGTESFRPGWRRNLEAAGGGALMDVAVHAVYLTEAYHGRPVDSVSAVVRYDESGVDTAGYCRFGLGSGIGMLGVAWEEGGASLNIMGTEGHISFVFDEHMGYYGVPARTVRLFPDSGRPSRSWYMPFGRPFFTAELFEDIAATIAGDGCYPAVGEDARRAVEVVFAAYRSAATRSIVELPLPKDELYRKGLAGLASAVSGTSAGGVGVTTS